MYRAGREGIKSYYKHKIEELEAVRNEKVLNLRRLEAQRNELNSKGFFPDIFRHFLVSWLSLRTLK